MKKTLVSALTAALVVGAASTTFAAANPFSDVPSDHWAYDAVAQLAKDGVIEGYGDSTYRGDQNITRYEMAQMIARAMAKNDVSAADKAMIDKLAAEFSDELNNLGVRVSNLEKKTDNVKWTGEARWRFVSAHQHAKATSNQNKFLFRVEPTAQVNEHWVAKARIDYTTDTNNAQNIDTSNDGNNHNISVDRMYAQGTYGNTQINLGKLPFKTADGGMVFDERISGASVVFGKDVKVTVLGGRYNFDSEYLYSNSLMKNDLGYNTGSIQGIQIADNMKKFNWLAAYYNINGITQAAQSDDKASIWELGAGYAFDKNVNLNVAYSKNQKSYAGIDNRQNHGYNIEVNYKGANPSKKGSFGIFAAYRYLGKTGVIAPTYDAIKAGQKGWEFGTSYVFDKNIMGTVKYFTGKTMGLASSDSSENASRFFSQVEFFF